MPKTILSILIILLTNSCNKKLEYDAYLNWFNSDITVNKTEFYNSLKYSLKYRSPEYMALLEMLSDDDKQKSKQLLGELKETYQDYLSFVFEIQDTTGTMDLLSQTLPTQISGYSFEERLYYLSNAISTDIKLISFEDTVTCSFSHFERTYKLSPVLRLNLGFDKKNLKNLNDQKFKILFYDRAYSEDIIQFDFNIHNNQLPKLKI